MTYYINPVWFYLMNLSDWIHWLLLVFGILTIFIGLFSLMAYLTDCNDRKYTSLIGAFIVAGIVSALISAFIPSKTTCIEMMIASQVTKENVAGTREEVYHIIDYVADKLNEAESEE